MIIMSDWNKFWRASRKVIDKAASVITGGVVDLGEIRDALREKGYEGDELDAMVEDFADQYRQAGGSTTGGSLGGVGVERPLATQPNLSPTSQPLGISINTILIIAAIVVGVFLLPKLLR